MSATRRGVPRHADDHYATPAWCVDAILPLLPERVGRVLEPAAGEGAIVRRLVETGTPRENIQAIELNPERASRCAELGVKTEHGNFLERWVADIPALVITNPPYHLAFEFAIRCLEIAAQVPAERRPTAVALLLRLNWLASIARVPLHRAYPSDVFVLPRRPAFRRNRHGKLGSDAMDYAWFVWRRGGGGRWRVLDVPNCDGRES